MPAGRATSRPATTGWCRACRWRQSRTAGRSSRASASSTPTQRGFTLPLEGSAAFRAYESGRYSIPTTCDADASATASAGRERSIAADRWAFGRCPNGQAEPGADDDRHLPVRRLQARRIYELIYPAKNPLVMGLGYAVTRDIASFLRYETRDDAGNANPLALERRQTSGIRRAYGSGISSTGMYMRDFLYLGFNEDEAHRKVFDAVQIVIPGTHRLFANVEFADPEHLLAPGRRHDSLSYSYPPLTFAVTTDPISGIRDGILKRPATDPLVFQVDRRTSSGR